MPQSWARSRTLVAAASACLIACVAGSTGISAQASHTPSPASGVLAAPSGVGGCDVYPANNYWNTPVTHLDVDSHSDAWLSHMSPGSKLHPDFGKSYGEQPVPYGIPITVVGGDHPKVDVKFQYDHES